MINQEKIQALQGTISDYERQIKGLQAMIEQCKKRLEGLKQENNLPRNFDREKCLKFLETRNKSLIPIMFSWDSTSQGVSYWRDRFYHSKSLTDKDIIQIQEWIIMSYSS